MVNHAKNLTKLLKDEKKLFKGWGMKPSPPSTSAYYAFVCEGKASTIRAKHKWGSNPINSKKLNGNHYV